jgi:hypothetical protein
MYLRLPRLSSVKSLHSGMIGTRRLANHVASFVGFCLVWQMLLPTIAVAQGGAPTVIPIAALQGATFSSPYAEEDVITWGVVTGVTQDGFYLQDPIGDGDAASSEGLFAFTYDAPTVTVGECVLVSGEITEYFAKTELNWLTSIVPSNACGAAHVTPVVLPTLRPGDVPSFALEALEGMVVRLDALRAVVHGPTKRFGGGELEIAFLPAHWQRIVGPGHIFHDQAALSGLLFLSNRLGAALPSVRYGDLLHVGEGGLVGVLDYNFGKYQLLPLPNQSAQSLTATGNQVEADRLPPARDDEYDICSFNLHGLGRGTEQFPSATDYDAALRQRAQVIATQLQGCTVLALQETGQPDDARALAGLLASEHGLHYTALAIEGAASYESEFPLTNSILVDSARVTVEVVDAVVGCTPHDFGIVPAGECPLGEYPVFDRPPLMAQLLISGPQDEGWPNDQRIWVINNHWKSKSGDEVANARLRAAQALAVAARVQAILAVDAGAQVVVLGDLNDFYGGAAIAALQEATDLIHPYAWLPPLDRYTYIFNGAAQVLDHVLITPNLAAQVALLKILHIHADAPAGETPLARSDHDPVVLRLRPQGVAAIGGAFGWGQVTVRATTPAGNVTAESMTDGRGDFLLWGLPPGPTTLHWDVPAWIVLDAPGQTITQTVSQNVETLPGYMTPTLPQARHQTAIVGAWLALNTPWLADTLIPYYDSALSSD